MEESLLLLGLLAAIVALALVAKRLMLPYPIVFVVGGSLLAFIPNLPPIEIRPETIFLVILPPLLFGGGWLTDWREFRANIRPIVLLAIGLVAATTVVVAVVAEHAMPALGWGAAFALGAIISPPDAVAASAIFERFRVPHRIVAILEGEGLVNDASALVIYQFAIGAVVTGAFSLGRAPAAFVGVVAGGIATGLAVALAIDAVFRWLAKSGLSDSLLDILLTLAAPYAAYLPADALHVSGVLAAVTAGVYLGRRSTAFSPESRLTGSAVWDLLTFLFNGLVFLLIGLELRQLVRSGTFSVHILAAGALISAIVIVVRVAWVFPATYLPRRLSARVAASDPPPPWRYVAIIAWSGMRGIVSLAAALALPLADDAGMPFPGRAEIIFVTYCVIVSTLVFQGLSLAPIIRRLGIGDGEAYARREIEVRIAALEAGLAHLTSLEHRFITTEEWLVAGRLKAEYEYRIAHLRGHLEGRAEESPAMRVDHWLEGEALAAERSAIARLRAAGEIPDEIFRKVQYDLDLAATRLR
ncbi:MAG TPA: Na+/H+ antiporter [Candidatus Dormibacteraeota bacterium]|nr:Na+/H+ antiporter [Candidatus Dormibacteraeota bacterium]